MGAFFVRHVDRHDGRLLSQFTAPNVLIYEGMEYVYRQIFPSYSSAMTFQLGITGPTLRSLANRPNEAAGTVAFGPLLTFVQCTDADANEGGCYTDEMRDSFGYSRRSVAFVTSMQADGGLLESPTVIFANMHNWTPQDALDWDLPWTEQTIEQPPPEWTPKMSWESEVGYPWQRPRKRSTTECDPGDPLTCAESYMHQWDDTGDLDWLHDFRKMGGFPITMVFLADSSRDKLIAAALFRSPVLLRPGTALFISYRARIAGERLTRDFAYRFARYAFGKAGQRYSAMYCRPVLATAPTPTRRTTYAEIEPHFHSHFEAVTIPSWGFSAGGVPHVISGNTPEWTNSSGSAIGPLAYVAVYGAVGGAYELLWATQIDPATSVPDGDTLRVPDKLSFQLDGV